MSLQWQFAAYVLYAETFLVLLLSLPFISNRFWHKIFKFKFFSWIGHVGQHAFIVVAGILSLLFMDSIREIQKYETLADEMETTPGLIVNNPHTNKFRAQRNFYISLGAFIFWVVLRRLVEVISKAAQLEATTLALEKQALGASKMCETLMEESKNKKKKSDGDDGDDGDDDSELSDLQQENNKLKTKLAESRAAEDRAVENLEVMKKQAKATSKEYDRLMLELEKCQQEVAGDKKSE